MPEPNRRQNFGIMRVYLLGTKGTEVAFVRDRLAELGVDVNVMDSSGEYRGFLRCAPATLNQNKVFPIIPYGEKSR